MKASERAEAWKRRVLEHGRARIDARVSLEAMTHIAAAEVSLAFLDAATMAQQAGQWELARSLKELADEPPQQALDWDDYEVLKGVPALVLGTGA